MLTPDLLLASGQYNHVPARGGERDDGRAMSSVDIPDGSSDRNSAQADTNFCIPQQKGRADWPTQRSHG